jgi:2-dehydro-3-deoxy-D-arabinonate dehydratase
MTHLRIYKTKNGILIEKGNQYYLHQNDWDQFINRDDLYVYADKKTGEGSRIEVAQDKLNDELLPPIGRQEIWAAGVTYLRSRDARKDESKDAGGSDFYSSVYLAERPELFFKANPIRVAGPGQKVRIRKDSVWNVPEPELTLVISSNAKIIGYTIGNDMSSRDIEGQNPLYLPQAKSYDMSSALGPCVFVSPSPLPPETEISLEILRKGINVFGGKISISQMKRKHTELVEYLFRETSFPNGCLLMTGTGIIPPADFTLNHGDVISISIEHIGKLVNIVE